MKKEEDSGPKSGVRKNSVLSVVRCEADSGEPFDPVAFELYTRRENETRTWQLGECYEACGREALFLFEQDGQLAVPYCAKHMPISVQLDNGDVVCFSKGDRLTWKNPCGIGGAEVSGVVIGTGVDSSGRCYCIGIKTEPSESMRSIFEKINLPFGNFDMNTDKLVNGGPLIAVFDVFERAVRDGNVTKHGKV